MRVCRHQFILRVVRIRVLEEGSHVLNNIHIDTHTYLTRTRFPNAILVVRRSDGISILHQKNSNHGEIKL